MITVRELLLGKPQGVLTTTPNTVVYEALVLMAESDIGALPVLEGERLVGVLSERDYARGVILRGRRSRDMRVSELMSAAVVVTLEQTIEECMELMTDRRVRHLPVLEGSTLIGIVTIGDVVKEIISHQEHLIHELQHYIQGA